MSSHVLMENSGALNYKLEQLKNKGIHEQSAIASFEVKKRLQEFVLQKKRREAEQANSSGSSTGSSTASSSQDYSNIPGISALIGQELNPLRKTASEPNIKVRSALKAKVLERRSSPLLKRKLLTKRSRTGINLPISGLVYSSNPTLPITGPGGHHGHLGHGHHGQELPHHGHPGHTMAPSYHPLLLQQHHQLVDYSPPSSPTSINVQMRLLEQQGQCSPTPPPATGSQGINFGHPTMYQQSSSSNFVPSSRHNVLVHAHTHQSSLPSEAYPPEVDLEHSRNVQVRLCGSSHQQQGSRSGPRCSKPLVRTLSSPLPLGQAMTPMSQMLIGSSGTSSPAEGVVDLSINPGQCSSSRKFLLQHIRQTVLTRASSKQQLLRQSFEEETEAAVEQEMKEDNNQDRYQDTDQDKVSNSSSPVTGNSSNLHLTPKAKFKRQFQRENTCPGNMMLSSSTSPMACNQLSRSDKDRTSSHSHPYQGSSSSSSLSTNPFCGLIYNSNPSLSSCSSLGKHHSSSSHHSHSHTFAPYHIHHLHSSSSGSHSINYQQQQQHMLDNVYSPPSSPTSISIQMKLLEQSSDCQGQGSPTPPVANNRTNPLFHVHSHEQQQGSRTLNSSSNLIHLSNSDLRLQSLLLQSSQGHNYVQGQPDHQSLSLYQSPISIMDPPMPEHHLHHHLGHHVPRSSKPLVRTFSSPLPLSGPSSSSSSVTSSSNVSNQNSGLYSQLYEGVVNLTIDNNSISNLVQAAAAANPAAASTLNSSSSNPGQSSSCNNPEGSRQHLLQHIRQTVLTRASSKQQLVRQSFEEEPEQEMNIDDDVQDAQELEHVQDQSSTKEESSRTVLHLTPKAKFMRQFLQENNNTISSSSNIVDTCSKSSCDNVGQRCSVIMDPKKSISKPSSSLDKSSASEDMDSAS